LISSTDARLERFLVQHGCPGHIGQDVRFFLYESEGKVVKNRLHLDIKVGGGRGVPLAERKRRVEAKAARLRAAGATTVRVGDHPDQDHYSHLMQDPEGNEFCVV